MGIEKLLMRLENISEKTHLSRYKGRTIAVDAFIWIHKIAASCAKEILSGTVSPRFLRFFASNIKILKSFEIKPFLVFDGNDLPAKQGTIELRRKNRSEAEKKAKELESFGLIKEAEKEFKKAIEVTPQILNSIFQFLRREKIEFLVAPYEADAQLSYLVRNGIADLALTEDSDLILYKCPKTLFKLDDNGNCKIIEFEKVLKPPSIFAGFDEEKFVELCVLSGCDYLPSIKGFGLIRTIKYMRTYGSTSSILKAIESNAEIPGDYLENFNKAVAVFNEQVVFNPKTKSLTGFLRQPTVTEAGFLFSNLLAQQIAEGKVNPKTHEKFENSSEGVIPTPFFLSISPSKEASTPFIPPRLNVKLLPPSPSS